MNIGAIKAVQEIAIGFSRIDALDGEGQIAAAREAFYVVIGFEKSGEVDKAKQYAALFDGVFAQAGFAVSEYYRQLFRTHCREPLLLASVAI